MTEKMIFINYLIRLFIKQFIQNVLKTQNIFYLFANLIKFFQKLKKNLMDPLQTQIRKVTVFEFASLAVFIIGIVFLKLGTQDHCEETCIEKSCFGSDLQNYPCDCDLSCQAKVLVKNWAYYLSVFLIFVGFVGSIIGSVLICIYRGKIKNQNGNNEGISLMDIKNDEYRPVGDKSI